MADHSKPLMLATAAWYDVLGKTHQFQAAMLRGDVEAAEVIRREAHDLLDANLDQNAEAATHVRKLLAG